MDRAKKTYQIIFISSPENSDEAHIVVVTLGQHLSLNYKAFITKYVFGNYQVHLYTWHHYTSFTKEVPRMHPPFSSPSTCHLVHVVQTDNYLPLLGTRQALTPWSFHLIIFWNITRKVSWQALRPSFWLMMVKFGVHVCWIHHSRWFVRKKNRIENPTFSILWVSIH